MVVMAMLVGSNLRVFFGWWRVPTSHHAQTAAQAPEDAVIPEVGCLATKTLGFLDMICENVVHPPLAILECRPLFWAWGCLIWLEGVQWLRRDRKGIVVLMETCWQIMRRRHVCSSLWEFVVCTFAYLLNCKSLSLVDSQIPSLHSDKSVHSTPSLLLPSSRRGNLIILYRLKWCPSKDDKIIFAPFNTLR